MKYVLTGGPGVGKTTLIKELRKLGYNIIEEAARIIGQKYPQETKVKQFQKKIVEHQIKTESKLKGGPYFLDRCLIDNLAYHKHHKIEPPKELLIAIKNQKYDGIFFLEQLTNYKKDSFRKEKKQEAKKIHELLREAYLSTKYKIIIVPNMSIKKRLNFILSKIKVTEK